MLPQARPCAINIIWAILQQITAPVTHFPNRHPYGHICELLRTLAALRTNNMANYWWLQNFLSRAIRFIRRLVKLYSMSEDGCRILREFMW